MVVNGTGEYTEEGRRNPEKNNFAVLQLNPDFIGGDGENKRKRRAKFSVSENLSGGAGGIDNCGTTIS
jgi:hypothetical protein